MKYLLTAIAALLAALATPAFAADTHLTEAVAGDYDYVFDIYKNLHENPELALKEVNTSSMLAKELSALGFEVTERVGDDWVKEKIKGDVGKLYEDVGGYGVVAVMKNGDGPTVMLRADMDALPLEEKTGLPYESKVMSQSYRGEDVPVMHACAHDSHVAILIGAARQLVERKENWSGTLVLIGQPAEELGLGAMAMLEDGLFENFPKPDYVLATHTSGWAPAGVISYTSGYALANVDSVDITLKGVGAHGSAPHMGKDPIVLGSQIVNALQTLVSRELNPLDAGVVTVGSFQSGFVHNIIPDQAKLQLTVRSYDDEVRKTLLDGIERVTLSQALSAGLPEELMPEITIQSDYTPSTYNDPEMTDRVMAAVGKSIGEEKVITQPPSMGGEDFSRYHRYDRDIKTLIFWTGGAEPKAFATAKAGKGELPPGNHSPFFAPQPEAALKLGVQAMTAGTLELFDE